MKQYKMSDVVNEISERENNPSSSSYTRFVGLEHYVSGDSEIDDFGSTQKLDSAMKVFHSGDILVARRNVYLRRASVVSFDGLTSGDSIVLRPTDASVARLLPFILNTDQFWDFANQHADGSMSKRLSPKTLMQFEFSLPDEQAQEKYSQILWAMVRAKKAYRKLLLQVDELIKSQFIEMFGDPILNPMKWPIKSFSDVATVDGNMTTDYMKYADYPHIGIDSIEKGTGILSGYRTVKEDNVISGKYIFSPQHILYSKIRPVLNKVALPNFEGVCSADCYPILPKQEVCRRDYLAHVMRTEYFLRFVLSLSARSQMPKVNRKQLMGFKFPCPPVGLQDRFVQLLKQSDKSKFELKKSIESLDAMQKALVADMFQCHM